MKRIRIAADGVTEKQCSKCEEWFPADKRFFYSNRGKGALGLHGYCKACYAEQRYPAGRPSRKRAAACV